MALQHLVTRKQVEAGQAGRAKIENRSYDGRRASVTADVGGRARFQPRPADVTSHGMVERFRAFVHSVDMHVSRREDSVDWMAE